MKKLILLFIMPILLLAHPHLFIDTKLNFIIKKDKIEKLHISWTLDEMSSQIFMMDYDTNKNKKFDKKETQKVKKNYFDKQFIHIKVDGKEINLSKWINSFKIEYKKCLFIVNFTISFEKINQKKFIEIGFWDEKNYTAFTINRDYIKFKGKKLKTKMDFYYTDLFVADILKVTL